MFQLASAYLFDPDGLGNSLQDFRDLLLDVRDGTVFATAFENRLGISLVDYEARFFELMNDYLK